jgi:ABC-2 type transport system ATP-binding protein
MSDAAIRLRSVSKTFGSKRAVRDLDLDVPTGSVCGYLGPNGAGKTTTIRMIMSIIYPDAGQVEVLGRKSAIESKDRIGYLPEERGVYRKMKVSEFLTYMGTLKGIDRGPLKKRISDWLERVELPGVEKKKCEELSKGMQQKVQFLCAILHDPELIILDEPFSGLDPANARLLRTLINEQHAEGKTIIFSTHVLSSAEQVCDRVFMINQGQKVLDGPIESVKAKFDPRTLMVEPAGENGRGIVEGTPGIQSVLESGRAYEAHLDAGADPQAVMRSLLERTACRRVELRQATLEDIFLSLVSTDDSEDSLRMALRAEDDR